ncbi:DNA-3-methyladenine glycosylase I [Candidatus Parcubacteria bacterium]|nr:MAG: DNA-3-methyladenine glycosylase I [Candidatus Parcubacteria bacterium]
MKQLNARKQPTARNHRFPNGRFRCPWVMPRPLIVHYHDTEWGVPQHDDARLFEALTLQTFQTGYYWDVFLRHRRQYRDAFAGFDPQRLARLESEDVLRLARHPGIIHTREKISATISNARQAMKIQEEFGTFDKYLWQPVGGGPIEHHFQTLADYPGRDGFSDALSTDLRKRGFLMTSTGVCYAFMEAVGMVNDHTLSCFRHAEVAKTDRAGKSD